MERSSSRGGTVTGVNLAVSSITQSGGLIAEGTTITTRTLSTLSGGTIAGTLKSDSLPEYRRIHERWHDHSDRHHGRKYYRG